MSSDLAPALLTVDDLLRIVSEREAAAARLDKLDRQIAAFKELLGSRFDEITGGASGKDSPASFREVMESAITNAPHGVTYDDLRDALRDAGLGEHLDRSPGNFHNTISRLQRIDIAEKVGDRLFLKSVAQAMPADVRKAMEAESQERRGLPAVVKQVLGGSSKPLSAGEVIDRVREIDSSIKPARVYSTLSRMLQNEDIARGESGRYRMADQPDPASLF
jgi:hypothetical protein